MNLSVKAERLKVTRDSRWEEQPIYDMLGQIHGLGITLDFKEARRLNDLLKEKAKELFNLAKDEAKEYIDADTFNPDSRNQIKYLFSEEAFNMEHLAGRTKGGNLSYDADALARIAEAGNKFAQYVKEFRSTESIRKKILECVGATDTFDWSKYLDADSFLSETEEKYGTVHPLGNFGETNRIAYSRPGLSNLSKEVRSIICAREGYKLLKIDYRQQEPYLLANMLGIKPIQELMHEYDDFYAAMFKALTGVELDLDDRKGVKTAWLAISYGASQETANQAVRESKNKEIVKQLYDKIISLPQFAEYRKKLSEDIKNNVPITSYFGTERVLPPYIRNFQQKQRTYFNNVFQITGADLLYFAINNIIKFLNDNNLSPEDCRIYWTVYDEIIFQVKESLLTDELIENLKVCMEIQIEDWALIKTDHIIGDNYKVGD